MKKFFLIIPIIALFISCGSAPETTAPATPPPAATVNLADAKARAASALDKAKSIKADVAVKADFDKAMQVYNQAANAVEADAVKQYLDAETQFLDTYNKAKTMRDAAMDQINKAKSDIKSAEDEAAAFENEKAADAAAGGAN